MDLGRTDGRRRRRLFNPGGPLRCACPFRGRHQQDNALIAWRTLDVLRRRGWQIPDAAARVGFARPAGRVGLT